MPSQSKMEKMEEKKEWVETIFPGNFPDGFYFSHSEAERFSQCEENQTQALLTYVKHKMRFLAPDRFGVQKIEVCPLPDWRGVGYPGAFRVIVSVVWHSSLSAYEMRYNLLHGKRVDVRAEPSRVSLHSRRGWGGIAWSLKPYVDITEPGSKKFLRDWEDTVCLDVWSKCLEELGIELHYEESDSDSEETLPSEQGAPKDPLGSRECNTGETSSDSDSD